jgi:hypothetical protein
MIFFLLFWNKIAYSQSITVSGTVNDEETKEPIPYVNVVLKNTTTGTMTDTLGYYRLSYAGLIDTINFSAIGYYPVEKVNSDSEEVSISVVMKPQKIDLSEIEVKMDEGPVRLLLSKMVENKSKNNPDRYTKYSYRKYTKWNYQLNNVDEKMIQSFAFRNNPTVFKLAEDGSKYLPLYFSEQLVFNEVQKNPDKQKSTVLADKTSGVGVLDELEISGYTSALDMEMNFYDNYINLFTQNFVSPAADNGWFYYNYFLVDSIVVDGGKQYIINYHPRRYGENTFDGFLIVDAQNHSLVEVDGDLSTTSSLNFLKSMHLKSNYDFVNDSTPFYKRNQIDALFDYVPFKSQKKQTERLSLYFSQTSSVDRVSINPPEDIKLSSPKSKYETIKVPDALDKEELFWENNRMEKLSDKELVSSLVIDSISHIKSISLANNVARMSMTNYYDIGKIELGPVSGFFNTNKVEGVHLFMGGRTSEEISKNWIFWGGVGYGFLNEKVNASLGFGYKFQTKYRQLLKVSYDDNMIRNGENEKILYLYENSFSASENNIVSQVLKHDELDEIYREQKVSASYDYEWYPGLSNKLSAKFTRHYSPEFYPFYSNDVPVSSVSAFEINLDTRISKEEKIIDKGFLRMYMSTEYPIVHFTVGAGQTFYNNQSNYYGRVAATVKQYLNLGQTVFNYAIETGAYFGKLPYTMLDNPRGNETMGLYLYDFNMLNYMEFVHDKYIHVYMQYYLNGFFFRRIPLLKKANVREVLSARLMAGSVSEKQKEVISFPSSIGTMKNPYVELGAGVENILSVLRIEAVWRVTPKSTIGAPSFGLRAKFKFGL